VDYVVVDGLLHDSLRCLSIMNATESWCWMWNPRHGIRTVGFLCLWSCIEYWWTDVVIQVPDLG